MHIDQLSTRDLALRKFINHKGNSAVAGHVTCRAERVDGDVRGNHEPHLVVRKSQHGGQQAHSCHNRTTRYARRGDHGDAQHEDEPDGLAWCQLNVRHVRDRKSKETNLEHGAGQVRGGAEGNSEACDGRRDVVALSTVVGDGNSSGGGGGTQRGDIRRQHVLQRHEGVFTCDTACNNELYEQQHDGEHHRQHEHSGKST